MARSHWSGASWTSRGRGYCRSEGPPDDQGVKASRHTPASPPQPGVSHEQRSQRHPPTDRRLASAVRASDVPASSRTTRRTSSPSTPSCNCNSGARRLPGTGRPARDVQRTDDLRYRRNCRSMPTRRSPSPTTSPRGGTGPDGQPHSSWMSVSAGYREHGDGWKVIHEHSGAVRHGRQGAVRPAALTQRRAAVAAGSTQRFTARGLSSEQGLPTR